MKRCRVCDGQGYYFLADAVTRMDCVLCDGGGLVYQNSLSNKEMIERFKGLHKQAEYLRDQIEAFGQEVDLED